VLRCYNIPVVKNMLFARFLVRWAGNSLGLWTAGRLISGIEMDDRIGIFIIAGLVLSIINAFVKPLVVLLSLSAILLTLGLFLIIVNGFMVWIASLIVGPMEVANFGSAVLAGMIIGLVNYAITSVFEYRKGIKQV